MKALVLAGGYPQIELILELKRRGITTVLADWNKEPVAKPYADIFYQESTLDIPAITRVAQQEQVDFLITVCTDQALLTVAQVSEQLGLPCYISYETALNVTNKAYMKKMFAKYNVPTSQYVTMGQLDPEAISHLRYPLIVKPVDCNSSKGVKKVTDLQELEVAFADAVRFSRTNTAIVEEFVTGEELSVDVYVESGKAHVLCVSNSDKIASSDKFVIFRGKYPAVAEGPIMDKIRTTAQQIAEAFGLQDSPMLIQLLCDGENIYVLEFSARTGGGVKYRMIQNVSGFNVVKAVVDLTLGEKPHVQTTEPRCKYLANEFIYCRDGVFDHYENFDRLQEEGVLSEYFLFKWKGARFDGVENSGDRVGGFTIMDNTLEGIVEKHNTAVRELRVIDENGQDMMRHDLLAPLTFHLF